jgi:hypothetical protein
MDFVRLEENGNSVSFRGLPTVGVSMSWDVAQIGRIHMCLHSSWDILTLKGCTDTLSRNVDSKLPIDAAQYLTRLEKSVRGEG